MIFQILDLVFKILIVFSLLIMTTIAYVTFIHSEDKIYKYDDIDFFCEDDSWIDPQWEQLPPN